MICMFGIVIAVVTNYVHTEERIRRCFFWKDTLVFFCDVYGSSLGSHPDSSSASVSSFSFLSALPDVPASIVVLWFGGT